MKVDLFGQPYDPSGASFLTRYSFLISEADCELGRHRRTGTGTEQRR
jgi:hypothetical protein